MYTKSIKSLAAITLALLAMGCNKEQVAVDGTPDGQEVTVTFATELPGVVTKAIGDGTTAKNLTVAVYEDNNKAAGDHLDLDQTAVFDNLKANVNFQLVKGKTYHFIFWAQATNASFYNFDPEAKTVSIDYSTAANDETRDAFYAVKTVKVIGAMTEPVELHRPFAQVNFGTADFAAAVAAGVEPKTSVVVATDVATVFDPFAGEGKNPTTVTTTVSTEFTAAALPTDPETLTVENVDYKYLAMNYIIPTGLLSEKHVTNLTATFTDGNNQNVEVSVPSAPVQANWRTNIVGNLLTDQVIFNVEIKPAFEDDIDVDITNVNTVTGFNAALANGGKITLIKDLTVTENHLKIKKENTEISIAAGVTLTGDFSNSNAKRILSYFDNVGHQVLSGEGTIVGPKSKASDASAAIELEDNNNDLVINGNLTVKGAKGTTSGCVDAAIVIRAGKVTINGGHFISDIDADGKENPVVYMYSPSTYRSELVINGGTFESLSGNNKYLINKDGDTKDHCTVSICGGTFIGFDPGDNEADGPHTNYVAAGYHSTKVSTDPTTGISTYVVTKDSVTPVSSNEGLNAAFNEAANAGKEITVNLSEGTFNWPDSKDGNNVKFPKTINVVGTSKENCFVKFNAGSYPEGSDVNFENVTIENAVGCDYAEASLAQMVRVKDVTVKNCIIKNQFRILAYGTVTIKDCQFINTNSSGFDGYCLNYYGYDGSTVNVEDCTFDTVQKAIVLYSEGYAKDYNLNVKNCKFTASDSSTDKAAVQMHTEYGIHGNVTITNCTATGFKANTLSPEGLWWEGNNGTKVATKNFNITIDGTKVQTAE